MPLFQFLTRANWIIILIPAGGGKRRHLLASNVWTKNLLSLGQKSRRCRLCRAAGTARDRALLRLKCSCLLQERPGCNWDWAMGGGREEVTKRGSFRSPRTAQRQLSSINPNSVSKYATGQLAPHAPENEEPCGKHQAMDLRRGKGRVKSCPVLRLRSGTHRSGRRV